MERPKRKTNIPTRFRNDDNEKDIQPPPKKPKVVSKVMNPPGQSNTDNIPSVSKTLSKNETANDNSNAPEILENEKAESEEVEIPDLDSEEENDFTSNIQATSSSLFPLGPPNKKWSITELKEFLKHHRKKCSSMDKKTLVNVATVTFHNYSKSDFTPEDILKLRHLENSMIEKRKTFDRSDLDWKDITECDKEIIPNNFNLQIMETYLRLTNVSIRDKLVDSEVAKPSDKGREMYLSELIEKCQMSSDDQLVMFRAEIGASMKNIIR